MESGNSFFLSQFNETISSEQNSTVVSASQNSTGVQNSTSPPVVLPKPVIVKPPAPRPLPVKPSKPSPPPIAPGIVFENKMYAQPGVSYQRFGHKTATNKNFVAVGTSVSGPDSKVYLFEELFGANSTESEGWSQRGFVASNSAKSDGFGSAMDMDDFELVVGAPLDDSAGFSSGVVYVFNAEADQLFGDKTAVSQVLRAPVSQKGASFGAAVCLWGGVLVIGSPGAATENGPSSGIVYIYEMNVKGKWLLSYQSDASGLGSPYDNFGSAIALTDTTLAVSATGYSQSVRNGGAVYLYSQAAINDTEAADNSWAFDALLAPADLTAYAFFGHTLAFLGDVGLVSAYSSTGSGVVYLYERISSVWELQSILLPSDPTSGFNQFGVSLLLKDGLTVNSAAVTTNSIVAVVGSPGDSSAGTMSGAIYLFTVESTVSTADIAQHQWQLAGKVTSNDSSSYSSYGQSVAVRGVDLFVGAELADSPSSSTAGVVYIESNLISYYLQ
eukprot:gene40784-50469_t